jgi:branched-chain amino acid transport system substrate-binding protein
MDFIVCRVRNQIVTIMVAFFALIASSVPVSFGLDLPAQIEHAESLFRSGDYGKAAEVFAEVAALSPNYEGLPALLLNEARARYYARQYARSENVLQRLISEFRDSPYVSSSYYFLARIDFERSEYRLATANFVLAHHYASGRRLKDICQTNVVNLLIGYLSYAEQKSILSACHRLDKKLFSSAIYDASIRFSELGLNTRAERMLDIYAAFERDSDPRFETLRNELRSGLPRSIDIALLFPLSGELAAYGRQMSSAVELAVETYPKDDVTINLKTYDTFGNSIVAAQLAQRATTEGVSVVLGPLTSQEAVGAAPYSDFWSVPMVLPVASEKGLTSISKMTYQLSPTPEVMGERLGEAAIEELGLDSVAILAPNDGYGRQMTDGFKRVMEKNQVDIFSEVYYPRGATDYRRFMLDLKETVLPDSFDPRIFLDEKGDTLELEEVYVRIPAIFVPAFAEELRYIIPQLRFYRIESILLGGEDLGNDDVLSLKAMKLFPSMFVSHTTFTPSDTAWIKFEYMFRQKNGRVPTTVAGMTYDAVCMTIEAAELGGFTADGIARGWERLGRYDGVTGPFEFNDQRENVAAPVYFLLDGQIEKWLY